MDANPASFISGPGETGMGGVGERQKLAPLIVEKKPGYGCGEPHPMKEPLVPVGPTPTKARRVAGFNKSSALT